MAPTSSKKEETGVANSSLEVQMETPVIIMLWEISLWKCSAKKKSKPKPSNTNELQQLWKHHLLSRTLWSLEIWYLFTLNDIFN